MEPSRNQEQSVSPPLVAAEKPPGETSSSRPPSMSAQGLKQEKSSDQPPHSIFENYQKSFIVATASFAAMSSPLSGNIYYPALQTLADQLNVSLTLISLTITTYLICQGIAPSFVGSFSDRCGRRPAYLICFTIYLAANIGLALQKNYAALLVLRMVQSSGSSGTVAFAQATIADVATSAERGKYTGYVSIGTFLGPAIGPAIGGILIKFINWQSVFWFLAIYAVVMLVIILVFLPETCRNIVGNGSVPAQPWNISLISYLRLRKLRASGHAAETYTVENRRRPNPLTSVRIIFEKETGLILLYGGFLYAGFYILLTGLPSQLKDLYGFNSLQVGLCYIPVGCGSVLAGLIMGRVIDWNFRRHATRLGVAISRRRQQDLAEFPIEQARLEVTLPVLYVASATFLAYGWTMQSNPPLGGCLFLLFINTFLASGAFNAMSTLIIDTHLDEPATATAANNLVRCLMGAGGVAAVQPMLNKIGKGWTGTFVAIVWLVLSPMLWAVWKWGPVWRAELKSKRDSIEAAKVADSSARDPESAKVRAP